VQEYVQATLVVSGISDTELLQNISTRQVFETGFAASINLSSTLVSIIKVNNTDVAITRRLQESTATMDIVFKVALPENASTTATEVVSRINSVQPDQVLENIKAAAFNLGASAVVQSLKVEQSPTATIVQDGNPVPTPTAAPTGGGDPGSGASSSNKSVWERWQAFIIAGIVVGALILISLLWCLCHKKEHNDHNKGHSMLPVSPSPTPTRSAPAQPVVTSTASLQQRERTQEDEEEEAVMMYKPKDPVTQQQMRRQEPIKSNKLDESLTAQMGGGLAEVCLTVLLISKC
jgi:hypothetical protein